MNDCAIVREKSEQYFLACEEESEEMISGLIQHLGECPECKELVGNIYGLGQLLEGVAKGKSKGHYSDFELAGLLITVNGETNQNRQRIREHVDSCNECRCRLRKLIRIQKRYARQFIVSPKEAFEKRSI